MLEEWRRLTKSGIVLFVSSQGNVVSDSFVVTSKTGQTGKKWKHLFPDIIRKIPEGGKRKLSDADVIAIRKSSMSAYELSRSSIKDIQLFNTYKDVVAT